MTKSALPTVFAKSMIYAQAWAPTSEERAAITARADFFESIGMSRSVNIKVVDPSTGGVIGSLAF